jgi:hypothetical protein
LFFEEVNKELGNKLSISWREIEPGCGIFYVHDESDFFPKEVRQRKRLSRTWAVRSLSNSSTARK